MMGNNRVNGMEAQMSKVKNAFSSKLVVPA